MQGEKYLWKIADCDRAVVNEIAARHSICEPVAHVLASRGFVSRDEIDSFLFTSFQKDVPSPKLLNGCFESVERILLAIKNGEKILIFGDYDVDGITSTALLLVSLLPLGATINYYLPNRLKEGYGLSCPVVEKAKKHGYSLIITVDNGISANRPAKLAKELGIDLIITDHHLPHEELPHALAIVDPNQHGCSYPFKQLAGVGVAFKIVSLLYETKRLDLPDKVYELLMLGTVADVVPLVGENRFWVRHGLSKVNATRSLAISVLSENSRYVKSRLDSRDIGFSIAPQINALGRLDDPRDAVRFLISSDISDVRRVGKILKDINETRKMIDRRIYAEIEAEIINGTIDLENENVIVAASSRWPSGVIGLVAGRLVHNYGRPAFLFHEKKGLLKGSCRSIPEFDIFSALQEQQDLLISFGGHAHAAGLSLEKKNMSELKRRLEEKILVELDPEDLRPKLEIDAVCGLADMTSKLLGDLDQLEPFGSGNLQPAFLFREVTLQKAPILLKDQHVKCSVFSDGVVKPVIFFNRPDLIGFFNNVGEGSFDLAGYISKNEWNGAVRIEIQGLDVSKNN